MSFCDAESRGDDSCEQIVGYMITSTVDCECTYCGQNIPAGALFALDVWVDEDQGGLVERKCQWCLNAFDGSKIYQIFVDSEQFTNYMLDNLEEMDDKVRHAEAKSFFKKPEQYRTEFAKRFPEVYEELKKIYTEDKA